MIERGVSVSHRIIAELTDLHKQETEGKYRKPTQGTEQIKHQQHRRR